MSADPLLVLDYPDRPRMCFARPVEVLAATRPDQVLPLLDAVDAAARGGLWGAGYVGYEAAPAFDPALRVRAGARMPLAWFGLFRSPDAAPPAPPVVVPASPAAWEADTPREEYRRAVEAVRDAIARGDVYQVNYTMRLLARLDGDDFALYERVRRAQGRCYGAYLRLGRHRVLSASPELFFRRTGARVRTRPMKGTRPRGRWALEDERLAAELVASEKERAENLMIVDLLRNDLGRIARFGSVEVRSLFDVERYPTVLQMTSTIEADVGARRPLADLFAALFPCGSVTGAPKIAAMQAIAALERAPREVYCGAIGVVEPGGDCTFSVAIRTLLLDAETGRAEYGAGGGVTWDSTPGGEYDEAWAKAAVLEREAPEFRLLETLRRQGGCHLRLERHLARLDASARYFGFALDPEVVRGALERAAREDGGGDRRVRILVARDGAVEVETSALEPAPAGAPARPVALARAAVSGRDPFLFHKTTHRALHEARAAERPDCFDVLLRNEEGELTEFTRGNLVVELEGERWTPPVECGLLAGTFRAELLEAGAVRERILRAPELERVARIWLVNSVREWVPVRVVE